MLARGFGNGVNLHRRHVVERCNRIGNVVLGSVLADHKGIYIAFAHADTFLSNAWFDNHATKITVSWLCSHHRLRCCGRWFGSVVLLVATKECHRYYLDG